MSLLPTDDKGRKGLPLFKQITRYFPKALREVTKVSVVNNVRYNPDRSPTDINWNRPLSADQLGSLFRHMLEREVDGKIFDNVPSDVAKVTGIERVYVLAEAAWRSLAALELEIEQQEALALVEKEPPLVMTDTDVWTDAQMKPYQPYTLNKPYVFNKIEPASSEQTVGLSPVPDNVYDWSNMLCGVPFCKTCNSHHSTALGDEYHDRVLRPRMPTVGEVFGITGKNSDIPDQP